MKTVLKLFGYLSAAALAAAVPTALVGFTDGAMVLLLSALALGILSIGD
jgi:hypothetical protein